MFKYCPNVDQGIVIPIPKFKKSGSFVTVLALSAPMYLSFDNLLKLLVLSEPAHLLFETSLEKKNLI